MKEPTPRKPGKIVQKFSLEKLAEFKDFSATDKLRWLEGIKYLYHQGLKRRAKE